MALFKKKRTLDEILEDVKKLSPDEAKELHEKMDLFKCLGFVKLYENKPPLLRKRSEGGFSCIN